jgi:DNA repair protein RecO (recombination protein O)
MESYFVRDAFSGRKSNQKIYFQPLTILEIEAIHKNKGTLENFKEIKIKLLSRLYTDIYKNHRHVCSEVLHHSIHEEERTSRF